MAIRLGYKIAQEEGLVMLDVDLKRPPEAIYCLTELALASEPAMLYGGAARSTRPLLRAF